MTIKIGSWNIKGLNLKEKRKQVFQCLTKENFDIVCLQETKRKGL